MARVIRDNAKMHSTPSKILYSNKIRKNNTKNKNKGNILIFFAIYAFAIVGWMSFTTVSKTVNDITATTATIPGVTLSIPQQKHQTPLENAWSKGMKESEILQGLGPLSPRNVKLLPEMPMPRNAKILPETTTTTGVTGLSPELSLPRVLAIIFPQYHRDPLNDKLWGEGFTDWDNLRNAPAKNRLGFAIPRPTELGYYNLTDIHTRKSQGELAKIYNIDGFIYHHYWFYDTTHPGANLHAPLEQMLLDGHPDVPFCLNWCATKWQNTWHGETRPDFKMPRNGVLQQQYFPGNSSDAAITEHYNWLRRFFHHPNYIKVKGQPLFMLYNKKPGSVRVVQRIRDLAKEDGFPGLYLIIGLQKPHRHLLPVENVTKNEFQVASRAFPRIFKKTVAYPNPSKYNAKSPLSVPEWCILQNNGKLRKGMTKARNKEISGIMTSFDNTPRRNFETATIWSPDNPNTVVEKFEQSLEAALYYETCCFRQKDKWSDGRNAGDSRFILINSMNEWAEGMALEPSDVFGRRFLDAILRKKEGLKANGC